MNFRTQIEAIKSDWRIDHNEGIFLSGSCFAENIGKLLLQRKFKALINPLGISYNPISIHNLMYARAEEYKNFQEKEGTYFHYQLHSQFNQNSKSKLKEKINQAVKTQDKQLEDTSTIIFSYGTANVHELISTNEIINNCHKQVASLFKKRTLRQEEIVDSFQKNKLKLQDKYGKEFQFILTVSPVRHLKEGFRENLISKSILHLAVNQIVKENSNCIYFPSYEIMMDDLRDYRFYKDDLLHPNEFAVNYIWEKFEASFCSEKTKQLNDKIIGFNQSINHKAFQPKSTKHIAFLNSLKQQLIDFQAKTQIDFNEEITALESEIRDI